MKSTIKVVGLMTASLVSAQVLALDFLGAPKSSLGDNNFSAGIELTQGNLNVDRRAGFTEPGKIEHDLDQEKQGIRIGFGLNDETDVVLRAGKSDTDEVRYRGQPPITPQWSFDGSNDNYWGVGITTNVAKVAGVDIGATVSYTENRNEKGFVKALVGNNVSHNNTDWNETQFALGANYGLNDMINLYAGAFLHRVSGDTYTNCFGGCSPQKAALTEASDYGYYLGASLVAVNSLKVNLEYQNTGEADVTALTANWEFK